MTSELNDDSNSAASQGIPLLKMTEDEYQIEQQSAQMREAVYSFLASVFLQPVTEAFLQQIIDGSFREDLSALFPSDAINNLEQYLASLNPKSLTKDMAALKREFMALFAVPTGRYVAPFEDIYIGKTSDGQAHRGPLLGVRAIAAKRLYREAGAQIDNMCKELSNHVGVELSFMRFLCEREATALSEEMDTEEQISSLSEREPTVFSQSQVYRGYQIRFLAEHLTQWFPLLNEEIHAKSDNTFYRSIANFTSDFLINDLAMLKQQIIAEIQ